VSEVSHFSDFPHQAMPQGLLKQSPPSSAFVSMLNLDYDSVDRAREYPPCIGKGLSGGLESSEQDQAKLLLEELGRLCC
jgi:hypothetical protein